MNTQTQPIQQQPTVEQQNTPPQEGNKQNTVLLAFIVILLFVIVGAGAYLFGAGKLGSLATLPTPTPTTLPLQTPTGIVPTSLPSVTVPVTIAPKPTIAPNPDGNTYTSESLGVSFWYANKTPADASATILISESGSKVYVYPSSGNPQSGQSIERFDKSTTDSLSQAITKRFLSGIPQADCFVKINPVKPKPTVTKATIGYPIPADADQPNFTYGEKCPAGYRESNGMAYFFEDSTYPDRFYFVSIGQYGIPSQNSKPDSMWQDSIIVF